MLNFKLTLEYDGTHFCGWQVQGQGERTIQSELEKVLSKIFKHQVRCIASGRTDSGVHALGQVVSFKAKTRMTPTEIQKAANALLPDDIAVVKAGNAVPGFHAQYSVKEKTYRYAILNRACRSVFAHNRVYFYPYPLNVTWMRQAAKTLVGRHDFKSFQAHDPLRAERNTVRSIKHLVIKKQGDLIYIEVTANGFLYKMVRNIAGTLLAIGSGQMPKGCIPGILKSKDRGKAFATAPAQGLYLVAVKY